MISAIYESIQAPYLDASSENLRWESLFPSGVCMCQTMHHTLIALWLVIICQSKWRMWQIHLKVYGNYHWEQFCTITTKLKKLSITIATYLGRVILPRQQCPVYQSIGKTNKKITLWCIVITQLFAIWNMQYETCIMYNLVTIFEIICEFIKVSRAYLQGTHNLNILTKKLNEWVFGTRVWGIWIYTWLLISA